MDPPLVIGIPAILLSSLDIRIPALSALELLESYFPSRSGDKTETIDMIEDRITKSTIEMRMLSRTEDRERERDLVVVPSLCEFRLRAKLCYSFKFALSDRRHGSGTTSAVLILARGSMRVIKTKICKPTGI